MLTNSSTVVTIVVVVVLLSVFEFSEYRGARPSNLLIGLKTIATLQSGQPVDDGSQTKCCQPVDDGSQMKKCSLQFLRDFAARHHRFPSLAFQTVGQCLSDAEVQEQSKSASCWFPMQFDGKNTSTACNNLPKIDVKRIVIFGDSNGWRYLNVTVRLLKEAAWSCEIIKQEKNKDDDGRMTSIPTISYFIREPRIKLKHLQVRSRDCYSCLSTLVQCKLPQSNVSTARELSVEYIALEFTIDAEVTTHRTLWTGTCRPGHKCEHSATYQEFILKEYLRGQYPDVVFFFASTHDIVRFKLRHLRHNYDFLFGLMDIYLPMNTTVIFMTVHKFNLMKTLVVWLTARYDDGTLTGNDALQRQNGIMPDALEKYLLMPGRQWYAFPNLFDTSSTTDHLYEDGVHRSPEWYDHIMRNLLYLLTTRPN